jgi:glycosyltransferase involved in cell wall biosynthesis
MITIYTMAYNEEVFLQFMIDHYRNQFPNCKIVLYDNESTDNTAKIAADNNCEIIPFRTNNFIDDFKIRDLKNNCWKSATTDWVLVCDVDELLNISEDELKAEESKGVTIIKSEGWNMVNMEDNYDFANIKHGCRVPQYDKGYLFNHSKINEINYSCGCHSCSPRGTVKYSNSLYKLYHYKCLNPDYHVQRFHWTAKRLSLVNKKNGMGTYWLASDNDIRAGFNSGREQAKNNKIIP